MLGTGVSVVETLEEVGDSMVLWEPPFAAAERTRAQPAAWPGASSPAEPTAGADAAQAAADPLRSTAELPPSCDLVPADGGPTPLQDGAPATERYLETLLPAAVAFPPAELGHAPEEEPAPPAAAAAARCAPEGDLDAERVKSSEFARQARALQEKHSELSSQLATATAAAEAPGEDPGACPYQELPGEAPRAALPDSVTALPPERPVRRSQPVAESFVSLGGLASALPPGAPAGEPRAAQPEEEDLQGAEGSSLRYSTPSMPQAPTARLEKDASPAADAGREAAGGVSIEEAAAAVAARGLAELRSFRNPPVVVCQVLEAVGVLLGATDTSWAGMRRVLDSHFVERLQAFDPSGTTWLQASRLRTLLQVPTFGDGSLAERCPAAAPLAAWCGAVGRHLAAHPPPRAPTPRSPAGAGGATPTIARTPVRGSPAQSARSADGPSGAEACGPGRPDLGGLRTDPDLWALGEASLASVRELQVSREGVGSVTFHGATDCRGLLPQLTGLVVLSPGEVVVYPDPKLKPPVGEGLNRPASIVLYGCVAKTHGFKDEMSRERYKRRVRQMTEDKGAEFLSYDCDNGVWQFRVAHF